MSATEPHVPSAAPAFRCAAASLLSQEPMVGTAPTEQDWLFLEYSGPWGRHAVAESRLPEPVRAHLADLDGLPGVRVQVIRRHGREEGAGTRVFLARLGQQQAQVWTTLLDGPADVVALPLAAVLAGADPGQAGLRPHHDPVWLVCTNGRRDLCCAEAGRPVAAALAARWPEQTWETNHLGGHRFAGTLLALPSAVTLGRLDADTAVLACTALADGVVPMAHSRGRAGLPGVAQVADLHLREQLGQFDVDAVQVEEVADGDVTLRTVAARGSLTRGSLTPGWGQAYRVQVEASPGEPRRQSCGEGQAKPSRTYTVQSCTPVGED